MEIGAAGTLAAGFSVFAGIFGLLYLGLVYFEARRAEIPPGVSNRKKLCALHYSIVGMEVGCQILEHLGVCSQLTVFRLLANYMNHKTPVAPPGLRIKDMTFGGVPVRVYEPTAPSDQKRRGMMYFHGGGWVLGNITMYDEVCKHIAKESDTTIVSVGYRLAPEHRFPAHLDDCEAATLHFFSVAEAEFGVDPHRVVLGGDSAGGNLSAALSQRLAKKRTGDVPSPLALVLIYPALQMADFTLPSYLQNQSVPLLYRDKAAYYILQYLNGDMSVCQEVLAGRHVPAELKAHYSKWLDPANLPPEFRERSYQKPEQVVTTPDTEVYQIIKDGLQPEFSPLLAEDEDLRLTPSTFILTCEYDVLRDDGILFQKRLKDLGVDVTWHHVSDCFHGALSFFNNSILNFSAGDKAMGNIVNYIKSV
ncbi:arylacetamide deacetylase-like 4 isoform X1 [Astyanax mexicanus]|uniref:arylacetamide deacetylase-like 4 isoform X1 n=1 Tax=Astyanax mexicanus TaxID=7994 RepID=UPI0020CB55BC|nr:arylacetamide deacetylase-like 4 isoform X1 [Astyanax mexicanus]